MDTKQIPKIALVFAPGNGLLNFQGSSEYVAYFLACACAFCLNRPLAIVYKAASSKCHHVTSNEAFVNDVLRQL